MATREDGWHSLAGALSDADTSQLLRACAPADQGRGATIPNRAALWKMQGPAARMLLGSDSHCGRAEPGSAEAGANSSAGQGCPDQQHSRPTCQHGHIPALAPPSPGQGSTIPAVSINKLKHFPAQQPEPLLDLHLCVINETVGHLHIS